MISALLLKTISDKFRPIKGNSAILESQVLKYPSTRLGPRDSDYTKETTRGDKFGLISHQALNIEPSASSESAQQYQKHTGAL